MFAYTESFSGFSVDDLAKAKDFYSQVLGLETEDGPFGMELKPAGQNHVFVYPKDNHIPATYTVLNFKVDNIDQAIDALAAKGVVFERYEGMPGEQDEKGVLRGLAVNQGPDIAWFKDPAGNILSVLQET